MSQSSVSQSQPVLLGAAQKAQREGHAWNLIGLSTFLLMPFFPQVLTGLTLVLGLPSVMKPGSRLGFVLRATQQPDQVGWVNFDIGSVGSGGSDLDKEFNAQFQSPIANVTDLDQPAEIGVFGGGASPLIVAVPFPTLFITEPQAVEVYYRIDDGPETLIGILRFLFVQTAPLSAEEVDEIASTPGRTKAIYLGLSCKKCDDSVRIVREIRPGSIADDPEGDAIPLESMGDSWACKCGTTSVPLQYAKFGLHELFRREHVETGESPLDFITLIRTKEIESVFSEYRKLIARDPLEAEVQTFLERHQLFWGFLGPTKVIPKPKILTHKEADFGILGVNRTLWLVEIEKPQTAILKKRGGQSAELQAGMDQINDWRQVVQNHRHALLTELGIKDESVGVVKYILVAGRSTECSTEGLRTVKSGMPNDTEFITFDQLGSMAAQSAHVVLT